MRMTCLHWCVSSCLRVLLGLNSDPHQFVIDEVDEDLENLEVALSNEVSPGKRRRRLSLLVIVSAVIVVSAFEDLMLNRCRGLSRS